MRCAYVLAVFCLLLFTGATSAAETAIYTIHANVAAALTFPASEGIRSIEYLAPQDDLRPVPLQSDDATVSFILTPQMMPEGTVVLVVNRPAGMDLSDREPPRIISLSVDGQPAQPAESLLLPFQPVAVDVGLADESGIGYSGLQVSANGARVPRGSLRLVRADRGRQWMISYTRPEAFSLRHLRIAAEDRSLLANQTVFLLTIEQGLAVLDGEEYSGGKALHFATETAYVAVRLELPSGEYEVEAVGHAPNSGANSWYIELDGARQADVVHIPEVEAGVCSRTVDIDPEQLPRFTVTEGGAHVLALTLREGPGPVLDRLRILRNGQEVAVFEGEGILPRFPKP